MGGRLMRPPPPPVPYEEIDDTEASYLQEMSHILEELQDMSNNKKLVIDTRRPAPPKPAPDPDFKEAMDKLEEVRDRKTQDILEKLDECNLQKDDLQKKLKSVTTSWEKDKEEFKDQSELLNQVISEQQKKIFQLEMRLSPQVDEHVAEDMYGPEIY